MASSLSRCFLLLCLVSESWCLMCGTPGRSGNETSVSLYSAPAYSVGQRAEYACKEGFTLLGEAVRTCQEDGSWSGLRPRCVPNAAFKRPVAASRVVNHYRPDLIVDGDPETCIYLDMRIEDRFIQIDLGENLLINGLVIHVPDGYVQEVSVFIAEKLESGTGIQYRRCTPSISRAGSPKLQVECRNEIGVPAAVPGRFLHIRDERKAHDFYFALCEIEIYALPETPLACGIPDQPAFAVPVNETQQAYPHNTFDVKCQTGFRRVPELGLLRCVNGQWIGPSDAYRCQAVECDPLGPLMNGQIDLFPVRGLSNNSFNTVARHRCLDGYMIFGGDVTRTCGHNGKWTGNAPICRPVDCGLPRSVSNAVYTLVDGHSKPGAIVQYNCFDGFVPQRILADKALQTSIVCQRSGAWKEGNFYCAPRSTYYYPPVSIASSTDKTSESTEDVSTIEEWSTSPRIIEIDFVQPTPGLELVDRHDETTSNGTAALATGFVIAFVLVLMLTVGIALNICRMRVAFDEARKRIESTGVVNQFIKAAESITQRTKERRNASNVNTMTKQVGKVETEPVYNELDDRFGLGALFPPPLFSNASSTVTSEEEGTYLDIDLSKNVEMDADSLQSLESKRALGQVEVERPALTSEEVLLLYAKVDKSKKTRNRIASGDAEENDGKGETMPSFSESPIISKDRSLPRRRDYHPKKVNDLQWPSRVVEVSINEPKSTVTDGRPLPPLPKESIVVADEAGVYATLGQE